jgi:DNA modification methylase
MARRSMQVVQAPLASLRPYERNSRTHSEEQIAQLARSIQEFGWTVPILVDKHQTIVAGHARAAAAKLLGLAHVPTIQLGELTEQQVRAYVIADNRLAELATWDDAALSAELGALEQAGFDLELVGFEADELLAMLGTSAEDTSAVDNHVPEAPARPVTRPGDVWVLGLSRLMCGDATKEADVLRACGGVRPFLMLTDPPYGVAYDPEWRNAQGLSSSARTGKITNDDRVDWTAAWRLFPGDVAYVWHASIYTADVLRQLARVGLDVRSQIVWKKNRFAISRGHYHWQHECCWYAVRHGKQARWAGGRGQSTFWEVQAGEDDGATVHGSQKPVELMRRALRNHALEGRAVYEPFSGSGSGSTLIACQREGLALRALELEPRYVDVALERWATVTGQEPRLEVDGAPGLAEVRRQRSE